MQISPLVIGIDNNALGQQVVGANENSVQPVREALVDAILGANCNLATEITVGDIGLGVLSGGGNLNVDFGGAGRRRTTRPPRHPSAPAEETTLPSTSSTGNGGSTGNSGSARQQPAPSRATAA